MTLETTLFETLAPLVQTEASPLKGRIYPGAFPQEFTYPAMRYQVVSAIPPEDICGDGDEETDEVHIQLDIVDYTQDGVWTLMRQVRLAMKNFDPPAILEDWAAPQFDEETKSFRGRMDYRFDGSSSP